MGSAHARRSGRTGGPPAPGDSPRDPGATRGGPQGRTYPLCTPVRSAPPPRLAERGRTTGFWSSPGTTAPARPSSPRTPRWSGPWSARAPRGFGSVHTSGGAVLPERLWGPRAGRRGGARGPLARGGVARGAARRPPRPRPGDRRLGLEPNDPRTGRRLLDALGSRGPEGAGGRPGKDGATPERDDGGPSPLPGARSARWAEPPRRAAESPPAS